MLGLAGADGPIVMGIGQQRNRIAAEFGLILPGVSVRDDQALRPREYRIRLRGESVGRGEIHPRKLMAIPAGPHSAPLDGVPGRDPCYGLDAMWIDPERRTEAEAGDWTVVEAASVLTVHLHGLALQHADEILTRQAVADMVEDLKTRRSKLVEETIPAVVKLGSCKRFSSGSWPNGCRFWTWNALWKPWGTGRRTPKILMSFWNMFAMPSAEPSVLGWRPTKPTAPAESGLWRFPLNWRRN